MQYVTLEPQIPLALWVPLALAAAALLVAYGLAARDRLSRRRRAGVMALMTVALAVPLVVLLNPTWLERIPPPEGKPVLTILVDSSASMATPLYVKTVGGQTEVCDLEIELERPREEVAFAGQSVPVVVSLRSQGSLSGKTRLQLVLGDKVVKERDVELKSGGETRETFMLAEEAAGLHRYEIRAKPLPGEVTPMNNAVPLLVRVIDEPVRVLLLEGKPYWDTKFLVRTLCEDRSIELTAVIKLAEGRLLQRQVTRMPATDGSSTMNAPTGGSVAKESSQETTVRDEQWAIRKDAAEILSDADPRSLADRFEQHLARTRPERLTRTTAWDRWWLLAPALVLWGCTWGVRRWSGLV